MAGREKLLLQAAKMSDCAGESCGGDRVYGEPSLNECLICEADKKLSRQNALSDFESWKLRVP
jgi:hypothetical protein